MIETGVFDFDSITFDDVADANKDAEPTTRKPDMNMEDVKPESRAAASPKAGGIFNSDISNTLASQHSPVRCCPAPILKHTADDDDRPMLQRSARRRGPASRTSQSHVQTALSRPG